jgi:hypothetical protein
VPKNSPVVPNPTFTRLSSIPLASRSCLVTHIRTLIKAFQSMLKRNSPFTSLLTFMTAHVTFSCFIHRLIFH